MVMARFENAAFQAAVQPHQNQLEGTYYTFVIIRLPMSIVVFHRRRHRNFRRNKGYIYMILDILGRVRGTPSFAFLVFFLVVTLFANAGLQRHL